jgi:hypothetical protein
MLQLLLLARPAATEALKSLLELGADAAQDARVADTLGVM